MDSDFLHKLPQFLCQPADDDAADLADAADEGHAADDAGRDGVQLVVEAGVGGKNMFALGSNEEAARVSGVNVLMTTIMVFSLAGAMYGFTGFIEGARIVAIPPLLPIFTYSSKMVYRISWVPRVTMKGWSLNLPTKKPLKAPITAPMAMAMRMTTGMGRVPMLGHILLAICIKGEIAMSKESKDLAAKAQWDSKRVLSLVVNNALMR